MPDADITQAIAASRLDPLPSRSIPGVM